jgi:hypothetical protein
MTPTRRSLLTKCWDVLPNIGYTKLTTSSLILLSIQCTVNRVNGLDPVGLRVRTSRYASKLARIVRPTLAFETNEVVRDFTSDTAVLTVYATHGRQVCSWHGLHADGVVQKRKVFGHLFHGTVTKRTVVRVSSILCKAAHMHHMPAFQPTKRLGRLEKPLVTNRAVALKLLRNASVFLVGERHTGVASHTMSKIDSKTFAETACVTVRAVKDISDAVVVQIADAAEVSSERSAPRLTVWVDAAIRCRLQRSTLHAHDFGDCEGLRCSCMGELRANSDDPFKTAASLPAYRSNASS